MPTTVNRKFQIPNTGADVGVWGSADLNPNFAALDGILGSVTTVNLAGGSVSLTDAQQQVAVVRMTGGLGGNAAVFISQPGFWILDNQTTGPGLAEFAFSGGGQSIATAQGSRHQVCFDGTNVFFVNMPVPGTLIKLPVASVPTWIQTCTVQPYLPCAGGIFSSATYPALAALLGITFGNVGAGAFVVPDLRGRTDFDPDPTGTRLTGATMTPDGNTIGATGGQQTNALVAGNIPQLLFAGNARVWSSNEVGSPGISLGPVVVGSGIFGLGSNQQGRFTITVTPDGTVNAGSPNTPITNIPPAIISGITLIKT